MPEDNTNPVSNDQPVAPVSSDANNPATGQVLNQQPNFPSPSPTFQPPIKTPKSKSRKKLLLIITLLVLIIGGAAAWKFLIYDKRNNKVALTKETQDIPVLRLGSGEGPASVYFPDEGLTGPQNILDHQIYEGLVGLEDDKPVPFIAQSWTNPDENTWVFQIRPNVKFHTGKVVTAKEVKASLDDLKKYDYWSLFISTIASTEVTGDLEVTIKTTEPDALLLNRLVLAYITDLDAPDKAGNNGTGAYQVDTTAANNDKTTTLVAFDDYYGGHVKTRKLVFNVYDSDEALATALKNGEIDVDETLPIPAIKKELEAAGFQGAEYDSPGTFGLYMNLVRNNKTTILSNKDFREAVALATDRQTLIDTVGNNNVPAYQVIPKSLPGHDESIGFPKFDLTAAKASLAKSGYKNEPLEFVWVKELQTDPPIMIEQLKALGLNIKEKTYERDDVSTALAVTRAGDYDFFTAGFTSDISDARDILGALLSSTESSYPTLQDTVFDKLLSDSDKTFDPAERIQLLQKANKYIIDNLVWIPTRGAVYSYYYAKDLDVKIEFNGTGNMGVYWRKVGRIVN